MSSNKQKQAAYKERMRSKGYIQTAVWVHVDDKEKLKKYISKLNKAREN